MKRFCCRTCVLESVCAAFQIFMLRCDNANQTRRRQLAIFLGADHLCRRVDWRVRRSTATPSTGVDRRPQAPVSELVCDFTWTRGSTSRTTSLASTRCDNQGGKRHENRCGNPVPRTNGSHRRPSVDLRPHRLKSATIASRTSHETRGLASCACHSQPIAGELAAARRYMRRVRGLAEADCALSNPSAARFEKRRAILRATEQPTPPSMPSLTKLEPRIKYE
jgi:hypothetical protein